MISATQAEAKAAKDGAKAGAQQREREQDEAAAQHEAVRLAEVTGRSATWTRTYRAGTTEDGKSDRRTVTMREDARREVDGKELLSLTGEAIRLAAARLHGRHGIPELGADERADLRSALITKLLGDCKPGHLPPRDKLTRAYLVKRAEGMVLNDPDRQHTDATEDGMSPEDIAAASEARARDRHDRHDPMLAKGVDGTWPEVTAACAALADEGQPITQKAARTAAYLIAGGTVRGDWSETWGTSEGYAATRLVPEGAAHLRDLLSSLTQSPLYLAIERATTEDRDDLDHMEAARRWLASGLSESPDRPRSLIERRWRTELHPDEHAPVKSRTDRRIIITSDRTRAVAADRNGWTKRPS